MHVATSRKDAVSTIVSTVSVTTDSACVVAVIHSKFYLNKLIHSIIFGVKAGRVTCAASAYQDETASKASATYPADASASSDITDPTATTKVNRPDQNSLPVLILLPCRSGTHR